MNIDNLFDKYVELSEGEGDPVACGDLCRDLDDKTCKELYERLSNDPRTKDKLVKTLYFNYDTQKMRW